MSHLTEKQQARIMVKIGEINSTPNTDQPKLQGKLDDLKKLYVEFANKKGITSEYLMSVLTLAVEIMNEIRGFHKEGGDKTRHAPFETIHHLADTPRASTKILVDYFSDEILESEQMFVFALAVAHTLVTLDRTDERAAELCTNFIRLLAMIDKELYLEGISER